MMIRHWLNRTLAVHRLIVVDDGSGGQTVTYTPAGTVRAKVDQPKERERSLADQAGSDQDYVIYMLPDADVRRGDRLADAPGRWWRVDGTFTPSTPRYLRCEAELIQPEEDGP